MIELNGKKYLDCENISLIELLKQFNYRPDSVVVKHNQDLLKYKQFDAVQVKDGDVLKVFPFVGGG